MQVNIQVEGVMKEASLGPAVMTFNVICQNGCGMTGWIA